MTPDWEVLYHEAVLETDYRVAGIKIDSAVTVLCGRLLELGSRPEHFGERHRIVDALQTLHLIRRFEPDAHFHATVGSTVN